MWKLAVGRVATIAVAAGIGWGLVELYKCGDRATGRATAEADRERAEADRRTAEFVDHMICKERLDRLGKTADQLGEQLDAERRERRRLEALLEIAAAQAQLHQGRAEAYEKILNGIVPPTFGRDELIPPQDLPTTEREMTPAPREVGRAVEIEIQL